MTAKKEKFPEIEYSVDMIDINTNQMLKSFDSVFKAEKYIGKSDAHRHILEVCKGKRKTAYGYNWRFKNN